MKPASVKLIAPVDLAVALGVPFLMLVTWILPERLWRILVSASSPFYAPFLSLRIETLTELVRGYLEGGERSLDAGVIARELVRVDIEAIIHALGAHRPGGWRPAIRLEGEEHVRAALERGHGVVLWISHFAHASLVGKMAFHRAGFEVSHLSHPRHGFSSTRFGMRFLNPIRTTVENRYLKERVTLPVEGTGEALRTLRQRLDEGGVVSFTALSGRRPVEVPFLQGRIHLAVGAPIMALTTKAALLPVFTIRDGDGFTVTVGPPIEVSEESPRARALEMAVSQFATALEPHVLANPGQWLGWLHL